MSSHMEPLESYNGTPIYNRTGKYQTQEHKQGIYPTNAYFRQNSANITSHSARSKRKEKEPDHYDGVRVEWPDYICHFEQVALWNQWSEQEKVSQLAMGLRGSAQRVLSKLTMEDLTDYM